MLTLDLTNAPRPRVRRFLFGMAALRTLLPFAANAPMAVFGGVVKNGRFFR